MEKAAIAESVSMAKERNPPFRTRDGNDPVLEQAAIAESIAMSIATNVDTNEPRVIAESIQNASIMNTVLNDVAVTAQSNKPSSNTNAEIPEGGVSIGSNITNTTNTSKITVSKPNDTLVTNQIASVHASKQIDDSTSKNDLLETNNSHMNEIVHSRGSSGMIEEINRGRATEDNFSKVSKSKNDTYSSLGIGISADHLHRDTSDKNLAPNQQTSSNNDNDEVEILDTNESDRYKIQMQTSTSRKIIELMNPNQFAEPFSINRTDKTKC